MRTNRVFILSPGPAVATNSHGRRRGGAPGLQGLRRTWITDSSRCARARRSQLGRPMAEDASLAVGAAQQVGFGNERKRLRVRDAVNSVDGTSVV